MEKPNVPMARSFTLVELMVVVTVIGVLAGLVLGGAGAVRQRAARGQAKSEVSSIETALTRYQMDLGAYPRAVAIVASSNGYAQFSASSYISNGAILFTALWGSSNYASTSGGKQYLSVKSSMVNTNGTNYFTDPWGYAYGYYWNGTDSLNGGATPDVWSTGGQSGTQSQTNREKWITSWK